MRQELRFEIPTLSSFASSFHRLSFFATSIGGTSSTTMSEIQWLKPRRQRGTRPRAMRACFFSVTISLQSSHSTARKSLAVVPWTSPPLFDKMISDPQSLLGDAPLGGIIDCRHPLQTGANALAMELWNDLRAKYGNAEQVGKR
jgi:hypothetical protein